MKNILQQYLRRANHTTWQPVPAEKLASGTAEDQMLLLNVNTGEYFGLNAVGALIWELADGTRTVATIAQEVSDEYETVELGRVQKDTAKLARELVEQELAELSAQPSPVQGT